MNTSLYRIVSLGTVAANKARNSNIVEVTLDEKFPMLDGEVTSNATSTTSKGINTDGEQYHTETVTTATVPAEWRPLGNSDRQTSPDVRRGDPVLVYQFGDSNKYYWETVGSTNYRRLETIRRGISSTQGDTGEQYYEEWSSHDKHVTLLSTTMANGEKASYVFQFNLGDGVVVLQDSEGNGMLLDSLQKRWLFQNADGSKLDMLGPNVNLTAAETMTLSAKVGIMNFDNTATLTSQTFTVNANTTLNGNFDLKGDMTTGAGAEGSSGKLTLAKDVTILGSLEVAGNTHTKDLNVDNPPW